MKNEDLLSRAAVELLREKARGYVVSMFATSEDCHLARSVALEAATEIAAMPAVDAVAVVRCKDCVMHGKCIADDIFRTCGKHDGFCCVGKERTEHEWE